MNTKNKTHKKIIPITLVTTLILLGTLTVCTAEPITPTDKISEKQPIKITQPRHYVPIIPQIIFLQDQRNRTLTVISVEPDDVLWMDIRIEHEGDLIYLSSQNEYVQIGDVIGNLEGIVNIYYRPTDTLLAAFFFPYELEVVPNIIFVKDDVAKTLTVVSVRPRDVLWRNLRIESNVMYELPGHTFVQPGDVIIFAPTVLYADIYYKPTGTLLASFVFEQEQPFTVYIDDDFNEYTPGWNYDHFASIQQGINMVQHHGFVLVYEGIYYETVTINKPLYLLGGFSGTSVIAGIHEGTVLHITANDVSISGCTIQNAGSYNSGILIDSCQDVNLINNNINDNCFGIALECSTRCLIEDNRVSDSSQIGILLEYAPENTIKENTLLNSGISSIHILGDSSDGNLLYHNNIIGGDWYTAYDTQENSWDNGAEGNYWYDFEENPGYPTLYEIPGGDNIDQHPLSEPYL